MMKRQECNDCIFFANEKPVYYRFDVSGLTSVEETEKKMNKRAKRLSGSQKAFRFQKMMTLFFVECFSNQLLDLDVDKGITIAC